MPDRREELRIITTRDERLLGNGAELPLDIMKLLTQVLT